MQPSEPSNIRMWPTKAMHVVSSGLRAQRVGTVFGVAYVWRVYAPRLGQPRWMVERVQVLSTNDLREKGERVCVVLERTRSGAIEAIWNDARALEKAGAGQVE